MVLLLSFSRGLDLFRVRSQSLDRAIIFNFFLSLRKAICEATKFYLDHTRNIQGILSSSQRYVMFHLAVNAVMSPR